MALTARGTRSDPAAQERRLHEQRHCQSNRMFTNHRWKRAKARHTTPKEQQGQEARILGKANRKRSRKPHRICHCTRFIRWIMEQVIEHKVDLDGCA